MKSAAEKSEFCSRVLAAVELIIACTGDSLDLKGLAANLAALVESKDGVRCLPRGMWREFIERVDHMVRLPTLAPDDARKMRREILRYENERAGDEPSFL